MTLPQYSHVRDKCSFMDASRRMIPRRPFRDRLKLVVTFTREIFDVWQTYGIKVALSQIKDLLLAPLYRRVDRRFDRKHGLDTAGVAPLAIFSILDDDFDYRHDKRRYEAVPLLTFARMMSHLPTDLSEYVFIDFGSGKGRAVLLACRYRFKRVIGIEFATELHAIAQRNIDAYRCRSKTHTQIELLNQNATCYSIPDDKCVFYFFNPFGEAVLTEVVSNIERSYHFRPRKMFFMYVNPRGAHVLDSRKFVRVVQRRRFGLKTGAIYETSDLI